MQSVDGREPGEDEETISAPDSRVRAQPRDGTLLGSPYDAVRRRQGTG